MKKNRPIIINTADLEHKGSRLHFAVFLSARGIFRPGALGNISVASSVNGNLCKNIRNTRFIYNGSAFIPKIFFMLSDNEADDQPTEPKFEPYKPKIRKPGTGCVTMINDHLYEGRYTPTNAYGKRESHNIYAKTREECEEKLAEIIAEVKAQIKAEKEKMTG